MRVVLLSRQFNCPSLRLHKNGPFSRRRTCCEQQSTKLNFFPKFVCILPSVFCQVKSPVFIIVKDIDEIMSRLEKISPGLATLISPAIAEISSTIQFAQSAGVM